MSTRVRCTAALKRTLGLVMAASAALAMWAPALRAAESAPAPVAVESNTSAWNEDLLRSYLQLQEQMHSLQLAVDKNWKETSAAAEKTAEQVGGRLNGIEQALAAQRARELEAMQSSNRVMLTVAGTFAGVGLLAMVCMAYFQWRTISRLAEISAALPATRLLGPGPAAWAGENHLLTSGAADESNARLMGSLDRLEKRLMELEQTTSSRTGPRGALPEQSAAASEEAQHNGNGDSTEDPGQSKLNVLLAKGQSLLNLDRPQEALAAFDEALKVAPDDPEPLLKRAVALERLGQLQEALECCERAIAVDRTSTMAYLQKGGLFNRMERFEEAVKCYEAALRVQS